ncbi:MAG: hypothetical protein ACRDRI_07520 [Pseudonocardiaceae bacterium]
MSLTDAGHAYLDDPRHGVTDPFAAITAVDGEAPHLRTAVAEVHSAAKAVAINGTHAQIAAAAATGPQVGNGDPEPGSCHCRR